MAYSARIDELEKKFSENARRYFAPLANEYRKAGDLDRAIEICRAHLPQQPGHMSGHIVYGQALYESRQLEEAKTVFEAALALDPENLIALRHLGDIARDSSDPVTARTWYLRVLDADPRNDEVGGMLAELDAKAQAEPPPASAADSSSTAASGWGDINPERGSAASSPESTKAAGTRGDAPGTANEPDSATDDRPRTSGDSATGSSESVDVADVALEPMPGDGAAADALRASGIQPPTSSRGRTALPPEKQQPPAESLDRVLNEAFASDADTLDLEKEEEPLASAAFANPDAARGEIAPKGRQTSPAPSEHDDDAPTLDDRAFAEVDALFDEISPPRASASRESGASKSIPAIAPVPSPTTSPASRDKAPESPQGASEESSDVTGDAMFGDIEIGSEGSGTASGGDKVLGLETREFVPPPRPSAQPTRPRDTGSMAVRGLTSFQQPTDEDSSTRAAFVTETMAELYLQQGFTTEALEIYRQLLAQNPDDANLRDRIEQLERGGKTSLSIAAVSSQIIEAAQQRHAARPVRTVRSFFGRLAGHHLQAGDEPEPDRDDRDDVEVSRTSDKPKDAPARPDAPRPAPRISVVSDLFGEAAVSEADEAAASMLASAFSASFMGAGASSNDSRAPRSEDAPSPTATGGTSGRPAHAAGRELSLDQVFRDTGTRTQRKSGAYSFEQFFSDGSQAGGAPRAPESGAARNDSTDEEPEGDLEQFTAWLEGLKRK